jgi:hypothetical protein
MWAYLNGKVRVARFKWGRRKLRLLACAFCRTVWQLLEDKRSRVAVEVAERFADGLATPDELRLAGSGAREVWVQQELRSISIDPQIEPEFNSVRAACQAAYCVTDEKVREATRVAIRNVTFIQASRYSVRHPWFECRLLRELFGNPPVAVLIATSWVLWRDGTIPKLAQAIYDERAFDRLPILADALEDAGCTNIDILTHCRQPGEHVRGCWVVDLLLGRH